eukprot:TRINITY_DN6464_c0_g1_i3.p1 TRINITY_DN6464_c0_g1~~TRINITY_DN6464_c0_g1_i3.p1  ORF type:complete len:218 (-),score=46.48 TRINITY_DN6464_c0_g1_i3:18-671(-)
MCSIRYINQVVLMGNCCTRDSPDKNTGVFVNLSQNISPNYEKDKTLTEYDIQIILKRIIYLAYNARLPDKRRLQSQRNRLLKKSIKEEYVRLMEDSRRLDLDAYKEVEDQVLSSFRVDREDYESATSSIDLTAITEAITKELLMAIRLNKNKLDVSKKDIAELKQKYPTEYDKYRVKFAGIPDVARRLSDLYEEDVCLNSHVPVSYTHLTLPTICSV